MEFDQALKMQYDNDTKGEGRFNLVENFESRYVSNFHSF
jgi:hypothetical protein